MKRRHPLPAEVYALVEHTPATVLLEGGKPDYPEGSDQPWTQLFTAPVRVCTAWQAAEIPALFAEIESAVAAGLSAAGFFSYECGNCFEAKAAMRPSREGQPLAWFGIYERSYVFDHEAGTFLDGVPPELKQFRGGRTGAEEGTREPEPEPAIIAEFSLTEAEYSQRIAAIHELIRAGDVYQLNFTAAFHVKVSGSVAAHYARLRARQPVDYGAFLHWQPGRHILSFSPELFFRIKSGGTTRRIVTRPMKGTARRGRTTREDREIAEWLRNDPKNRSENVMIVDLLRNDLGRVARTGTVHADRLFDVERYATLWQMTSTVSAELRPEASFQEIFRALFPSGSVTGAPKVRSMQLLAELEEAPRGVYTGAIGYFSPRQTVFNVAIRTLELEGGRGTMGAGSGIVIDSDAAEEYRECLLKAEFLTGLSGSPSALATWTLRLRSGQALPVQPARRPALHFAAERFSLIETLLWNGAYPFIELHLDRLADSAEYFGFACDRAAIRTALETHAQQFADCAPRKVRLLLIDSDGSVEIGSEPLPLNPDPNRVARVCISPHRTDPADPTLYHKTTQRPLYALEYLDAQRRGFDDVLFLNLRGEVTEGAISNIFVEKDGRWSTPPVACGLLAGVFRRHLLETRPEIEERVLVLDDLRQADGVYIANAVRGLRRVTVVW
ncbi:MAG: aminodeoxychorismate synthase component I [Terracidiphilus sp.]|nr:aminodeoxychorismate synthase component I [Terracidiphilus sp.]MDR3797094.1 aminodeoxychorismate synthase component I [Terracidiphilus sp.]